MNYININRADVLNSIDWSSPAAQQHKVQFTPYYKMYDPNGKLMIEGKEASIKVWEMIQAAAPKQPKKSSSVSGKVLRGGPVALVDGNERIRYINKSAPGERIEIESYMVKGKTNLFVFYSDY